MKTLDWRPRSERWLTGIWGDSSRRARRDLGPGGRLWAGIVGQVIARRCRRRAPSVGDPVIISVGNLALGGTGKTPVVIALAKALAAAGHRGCVLTRGYRSPLKGPLQVSAADELAGDEARLLAKELESAGWAVVQSRTRSAGVAHIAAETALKPSVILVEDGHQTAGVGRDLDVLILDHWEITQVDGHDIVQPTTGQVFPFGPWRESARGALRAGIWLLETGERVPERGVGGNRVVTFQRSFQRQVVNEGASGPAKRPVLVSGIARPDKFESGATEILHRAAELSIRLADHEPYTARLVERLLAAMSEHKCDGVVTTAKDWIKLAPFWPREIPADVINLEIVWGSGTTLPELVGKRL